MIVAGIDIGTLTCRLLIAEVGADKSFRELESDRRLLRLGEGTDETGVLSLPAMKRVTEALSEWQARMVMRQVDAKVVVATSAVRDAKNQQEFLERINQQTGLTVEVLSGKEEAYRTLMGIEYGLPPDVGPILGLDIGGGSTEFIRSSKQEQPQVASLNIGVVRLTERCFHSDPPGQEEIVAAEHMIQREMEPIQYIFTELTRVTLVGTAGTITTLAAMAQQLPCYDHSRIQNYRLSLNAIRQLEKALASRTIAERAKLQGLESGREGVIMAGTIILRTVMETLGFKECLVSDYGLREGIVVECAERLKK